MNDIPDWMKALAWPTLKQGKNVLAVEGIEGANASIWMSKLTKWMADAPADLAPMLRPLLQ
jgi:hypothetical protein